MEETGEVQERVLTVTNYDEEKGKFIKTRVTIAPSSVEFLIAGEEAYDTRDGREIRKVNIMLVSGNNLEVYISVLDLITLERAIGSYFLP